jgi:hypothetical protein
MKDHPTVMSNLVLEEESAKMVRFGEDGKRTATNNNSTNHLLNGNSIPMDKNTQQTSTSNIMAPKGPKNIGQKGTNSERFSFSLADNKGLETGSVRLHRTRNFGLGLSSRSLHNDQDAKNIRNNIVDHTMGQKKSGFVDGNFSSGKILDLSVERCHVISYQNVRTTWGKNYTLHEHCSANHSVLSYLAVGTVKGVSIYETSSYSLVYHIPSTGMISALRWADAPTMSLLHATESKTTMSNQYSLLVVGTLDGRVILYGIDFHILESQGPTLVHEFSVPGEVRVVDCCFFGKVEPSILLCVGDKSGDLTFCSLRCYVGSSPLHMEHVATSVAQHYNSCILGLSISTTNDLLATSTKGGQVFVYKIQCNPMGIIFIEKCIWDVQRSGPIRCICFTPDGSQLCFGGYDKLVVFVDTKLWIVTRQLQLNGTVS